MRAALPSNLRPTATTTRAGKPFLCRMVYVRACKVHVRYSTYEMYLRQRPFCVVWCMYIGCSLKWNDRMVGQVTDEREEKKKRGKFERWKEENE